jgi:hypothetical protein
MISRQKIITEENRSFQKVKRLIKAACAIWKFPRKSANFKTSYCVAVGNCAKLVQKRRFNIFLLCKNIFHNVINWIHEQYVEFENHKKCVCMMLPCI